MIQYSFHQRDDKTRVKFVISRCFKDNLYQQLSGGTCTVISYWPDPFSCFAKSQASGKSVCCTLYVVF